MYLEIRSFSLRQDYVFFIPPPPHYQGTRAAFSPSIDACWYGRVNLIFKMRVLTDAGGVMECQCALIETMYDYCPREGRTWWPSTAEIGTKLLYMPTPDPVVYIVPLSHLLGASGVRQPPVLHQHVGHDDLAH